MKKIIQEIYGFSDKQKKIDIEHFIIKQYGLYEILQEKDGTYSGNVHVGKDRKQDRLDI